MVDVPGVADSAMYAAKRSGGNQIRYAEDVPQ
jgi:GGDEF domain-containing protein